MQPNARRIAFQARQRRLGDLDEEDKRLNDEALIDGSRVFSAYILKDGRTKYGALPNLIEARPHAFCRQSIDRGTPAMEGEFSQGARYKWGRGNQTRPF